MNTNGAAGFMGMRLQHLNTNICHDDKNTTKHDFECDIMVSAKNRSDSFGFTSFHGASCWAAWCLFYLEAGRRGV